MRQLREAASDASTGSTISSPFQAARLTLAFSNTSTAKVGTVTRC